LFKQVIVKVATNPSWSQMARNQTFTTDRIRDTKNAWAIDTWHKWEALLYA